MACWLTDEVEVGGGWKLSLACRGPERLGDLVFPLAPALSVFTHDRDFSSAGSGKSQRILSCIGSFLYSSSVKVGVQILKSNCPSGEKLLHSWKMAKETQQNYLSLQMSSQALKTWRHNQSSAFLKQLLSSFYQCKVLLPRLIVETENKGRLHASLLEQNNIMTWFWSTGAVGFIKIEP